MSCLATITATMKLPVKVPTIHTVRKEIHCTESIFLYGPNSEGCGWAAGCTTPAKNCAKTSISKPLFLAEEFPITINFQMSYHPGNTFKKLSTRKYTTRH